MASAAYYLTYLQEAVESLDQYLLTSELFWNLAINPPPGNPPFPALTLGGILYSHAQLTALEAAHRLNASESAQLSKLSLALQAKKSKWRSAWEAKAAKSFHARLTQWGNFIEEYRQNPEGQADRYGYEVRIRLMLTLLGEDASVIHPEQIQLLDYLDTILRQHLRAGNFIWDAELSAGYSKEKYWYLFGALRK